MNSVGTSNYTVVWTEATGILTISSDRSGGDGKFIILANGYQARIEGIVFIIYSIEILEVEETFHLIILILTILHHIVLQPYKINYLGQVLVFYDGNFQ